MSKSKNVPYRINLPEEYLPKQWYNVRADMKELPDPMLNPGTMQPITKPEELEAIFCHDLAVQELNNTDAYIDIPDEIQKFYKMCRPSPLIRAYCLEEKLGTPAKIYYKFEGNNTSGSHKLCRSVGHGALDGLRLLRPRPYRLHGQGQLLSEALPQERH